MGLKVSFFARQAPLFYFVQGDMGIVGIFGDAWVGMMNNYNSILAQGSESDQFDDMISRCMMTV